MMALLCLCGCKTRKEIQTEYVYVERTDTLTQTKWITDRVVISDSVFIWQKGDTVFIKEKHSEKSNKEKADTIYKVKIETQIEYKDREIETVKEVNRLYWWQTALMWMGGIGLLILILIAIIKIRK